MRGLGGGECLIACVETVFCVAWRCVPKGARLVPHTNEKLPEAKTLPNDFTPFPCLRVSEEVTVTKDE